MRLVADGCSQSRVRHELNTILTYGSLTAAFKVMWKYEILDWLLPAYAEYLTAKECPRSSAYSSA